MLGALFLRFGTAVSVCCIALSLAACTAPAQQPAPAPEAPPMSAAAPPVSSAPAAKTTALPYTGDYLLFQDGTDKNDHPVYGLTDRAGKVLLPAKYQEISVAENGLIFVYLETAEQSVYQILKADGTQVGVDYAFIECASPNEEGVTAYRQASALDMRPVPPYVAHTEDAQQHRQYWLLDEDGARTETQPYDDIELSDDGAAFASRGGVLYWFNADGTVTTKGGDITATYFDGKYQVLRYFPSTHNTTYALLNREGKQLAPPEYCRIQAPFTDRYVLYKGHTMLIDGAQAFLYDETGTLLAQDSNGYGFFTAPDGSYIGVSFLGNVFTDETFESEVVLDDKGNPMPKGYYFVDRDGKRISERYTYIDFFQNEAAQHKGVHYTISKDFASENSILDTAIAVPGDAFFLAITAAGETVRLPAGDLLLDQ